MANDVNSLLRITAHRPFPLPDRPWRLRQTWRDLLFCHWPVPAPDLQQRLPPGLEIDTFDGSAWIGVIPFWMSDVKTRVIGHRTLAFPSTSTFAELNLRTYVRSRVSGMAGVYFFSLDCSSPLAVFGARTLFHLPYFPARMARTSLSKGQILYRSRRQLTAKSAGYEAAYGPQEFSSALQEGARAASAATDLTAFLTERYCLFTRSFGRMLVGHIHHRPWPLEPAQAEIRRNEIPAAHGIGLPDTAPVLHFSRELEVLLWGLETDAGGVSSYG
jgi:uncharacterized protein YqjF (DUF2071 family)